MRPKRYPYLKQRYVETIVSEVVIPYSSTSFGILGVLDTYTGNIVDYRRFIIP